jgi:hypothetical protein
MIIAIRKEPNGSIYMDKTICTDERFANVDISLPQYNYTKVEIDDIYSDCIGTDFNEDLTFSIEKYNARKQKENAETRIAELKQLLKDTDYKALKYAEGVISAIDYLPTQRERQAWRDEINDLENLTK